MLLLARLAQHRVVGSELPRTDIVVGEQYVVFLDRPGRFDIDDTRSKSCDVGDGHAVPVVAHHAILHHAQLSLLAVVEVLDEVLVVARIEALVVDGEVFDVVLRLQFSGADVSRRDVAPSDGLDGSQRGVEIVVEIVQAVNSLRVDVIAVLVEAARLFGCEDSFDDDTRGVALPLCCPEVGVLQDVRLAVGSRFWEERCFVLASCAYDFGQRIVEDRRSVKRVACVPLLVEEMRVDEVAVRVGDVSVVVQTPRVLVAVGRAVLVKLSRVAEEIVVAAEVDEIEAAWCDLGINTLLIIT